MFYIYRLSDGEQDYYGQTVDCKQRLSRHKCPSSNLCMSRLLNKDNMKLHVLHTLYTKQEADETEEFYILNMECVNTKVPCRTQKEYYQDNKEKLKKYKKEYYQNNKELLSEYQKEHYHENKEVIIGKQKVYRDNNIEKTRERHKEWYQNNKEKLQQKFKCECGGKYTYTSKTDHFKTKKHQNYING